MLGAGPAWGREDADGTILRGGILYEKVLELLSRLRAAVSYSQRDMSGISVHGEQVKRKLENSIYNSVKKNKPWESKTKEGKIIETTRYRGRCYGSPECRKQPLFVGQRTPLQTPSRWGLGFSM